MDGLLYLLNVAGLLLQDKDRELIALRKIVSQSVPASTPHPDGQERIQPASGHATEAEV